MLGKKLLTLGCAVGILLIGACYVPPVRIARPLHDMKVVRVTVTNDSVSHRLSPEVLREALIGEINSPAWHAPLHAIRDSEMQGPADGTISVSILKESSEPLKKSQVEAFPARVSFDLSILLVDKDGKPARSKPLAKSFSFTVYKREWNPDDRSAHINPYQVGRLANEVARQVMWGLDFEGW